MHAHSTYTPASCRLRLAVSDRKVQHTGPLANYITRVSSIKCKVKEQADFSRKYSETNPLKKLDWNVNDQPDHI